MSKKDKQELKPKDNPHHLIISELENPKTKWYILHTFAGQEKKTAQTLEQRVNTLGLEDKILELLIPTQEKIQIKQGKKKKTQERLFPGYMMIKMQITDQAQTVVQSTRGITGFVGTGNKPTPLPEEEVQAIKDYLTQDKPKFQASFSKGEAVKIVEGPFADMLGSVSQIDEEKGKAQVLVSIFGRETPVELDFLQLKKI